MTTVGELVGMHGSRKIIPCADFIIPDAKVGVEVEAELVRSTRGLNDSLWSVKTDGSLRDGGQEFTTNGGLCGQTLKDAIIHICDLARKRGYSEGTPRAGIHLHVDVTDLSVVDGELLRLITNYTIVEHILFAFTGKWRRDCGYCVPYDIGKADFQTLGALLTTSKIDSVIKDYARNAISRLSKYQAINLRPLIDLGTIEFRALPTTFDSERIILWVNTILALKKAASDPKLEDPLKLLSTLGPEKFCGTILSPGIFRDLVEAISKQQGSKFLLDEAAIWQAVDNVSTLVALGKQNPLLPRVNTRGVNPLMMKKIEKSQKAEYAVQASTINSPVAIGEHPQAFDAERIDRVRVGASFRDSLTEVERLRLDVEIRGIVAAYGGSLDRINRTSVEQISRLNNCRRAIGYVDVALTRIGIIPSRVSTNNKIRNYLLPVIRAQILATQLAGEVTAVNVPVLPLRPTE